MTVSEIQKRIDELTKELEELKQDVSDNIAYAEGIDQRRLLLENELQQLREELNRLQV